MFERYLVSRGDGRRTRWFRDAARTPNMPQHVAELIERPDVVIDMSREQILAIDEWSQSAGLGDPPLTINDRHDERPRSREFAAQLNRAFLLSYAVRALRTILLRDDSRVTLWPDATRPDVWHCTIDDSPWSREGTTPERALRAFLDMMIEDMDRRDRADA